MNQRKRVTKGTRANSERVARAEARVRAAREEALMRETHVQETHVREMHVREALEHADARVWETRALEALGPRVQALINVRALVRERDALVELGSEAQAHAARAALAMARAQAAYEAEVRLATQEPQELRAAQMLAVAQRALNFVELLVPRRIADEELGDALEHIRHLIEQGRPRWQVYLKVVTTIFWVLFNAFRPSGRRVTTRKVRRKKGSQG